jgi:hypothetical protein
VLSKVDGVNYNTQWINPTAPDYISSVSSPLAVTSGNLTVDLSAYAPLASPVFTGDARAVTPATADNDTSIATTAFVKAQGYLTSAPVTSVAGRTGAVVLSNTDISGLGSLAVINDAPSNGSQYARKDAAWDVVIPGDRYLTSSTTSLTINNGNKTLTVGTGLSYTPTQNVTISYDAAHHMHGEVLTYNSGTGVMTVDVNHNTGSGTYTSWVVNVGGVTPATSVAWGAITGTLSAQTDLQGALDLKANLASPSLTGNVTITSNTSGAALFIEQSGTGNILTLHDQAADTTFVAIDQNGKINTIPAVTASAGFNIPHGTAPTTLVNGDIWTTTSGLFARINGGTQQYPALGSTNTFSGASSTYGSSTATGTIGLATGATISGSTKTVNIGTGGVAGSTTTIAIGSTTGTSTTTLQGSTLGTTLAADTNTTGLATTAYVVGQAGSATPLVDGTAAAGASLRYARQDHVHPTDTTRAPTASPSLTGTPLSTTAAVDTNTTQIATTAFVIGQAGSFTPQPAGLAQPGSSLRYARADHIHANPIPQGGTTGFVLSKASGADWDTQWFDLQSALDAKANLSGATFTGVVVTPASTTASAGLRLPHGVAPTTGLTNGDVWTTTGNIQWRRNGSTQSIPNLGTTNVFGAGAKQTFTSSSTATGTNFAPIATDPSTLVNGDIWVNSTTNDLKVRLNGVSETVAEQSWVTAQGYLTSSALTGYATESFVTSQGYITSSALSPYLTSATAASTYQTISGMSSYLTTSAAASSYYPLTGNPSGFLTSAPVTSVAGRTGAITLAVADVSGAAPLASPTFSGTPSLPTGTTAVTQTVGDNTTALATTAFVTAAVPAFATANQLIAASSTNTVVSPNGYRMAGLTTNIWAPNVINLSSLASGAGSNIGSGYTAMSGRLLAPSAATAGYATRGFTLHFPSNNAGAGAAYNFSTESGHAVRVYAGAWGSTVAGVKMRGVFGRMSGSIPVPATLAARAYGWEWDWATRTMNIVAHNGTTLTTTAVTWNPINARTYEITCTSNGAGTISLYVDGVLLGTSSGGPTGLNTASNIWWQLEIQNEVTAGTQLDCNYQNPKMFTTNG